MWLETAPKKQCVIENTIMCFRCLEVQLWELMLHESGGCLCPDHTLCSFGARALTHMDWDAIGISFLSTRTEGPCCSPGGVGWEVACGHPVLCDYLCFAFFSHSTHGFPQTTHSCKEILVQEGNMPMTHRLRGTWLYLWKDCVVEQYWFFQVGHPSLGSIPSFIISP